MTAQAVPDGRLTDEMLGAFTRRMDVIKRRINSGTLSYLLVMRDLQSLVEAKTVMAFEPWLKGAVVSQATTEGYISALKQAGYFIADEIEAKLSQLPHLPMPYYADFAYLLPFEFGYVEGEATYKKIRERVGEIVGYQKHFFEEPMLDVGLALALELKRKGFTFGFRQKVVPVTQPWHFEGKDHLLSIAGDTEADCILLEEVSIIESEMFSAHRDHDAVTFALMGRPYHDL